MRDGAIVQSGKYDELLQPGTDFAALVAAHDSSMELVEQSSSAQDHHDHQPAALSREQSNGENGSIISPKPEKSKGTSKLVEEEERETGHVSWNVYMVYITHAWGWWGAVIVLLVAAAWQGSLLASDYWLAYETSADISSSFRPSLFIQVYAAIAMVSIVLITARSFLIAYLGLKTAQIFFRQILNSILHAPMSFFDTTPSGRILSRVSCSLSPHPCCSSMPHQFNLHLLLLSSCFFTGRTFELLPVKYLVMWETSTDFGLVFSGIIRSNQH